MGNYTPKVAVFAHPTDAAGTKGDFEGETTSIETSFYFHPLKTRELSKIRTLSHLARALIYIVLSTPLILGASPHLEGGTSVAS